MPHSPKYEELEMNAHPIYVKNHYRYEALAAFAIAAMLFSLAFDSPGEIAAGYYRILCSPSQLLTDYMAVGGIGASFFNAGMLMLIAVMALRHRKQLLTGPIIAALFTLFGFSLFGKNLFNTIPITLGVYLFSRFEGVEFSTLTMTSLFGSALGPAVSYLCFGIGLPFSQGFLLSYSVGILIGFMLPPLSRSFLRFHQGYTLYNIGFTCGIIGLFIQGVLRSFDMEVSNVSILSHGDNTKIMLFMYTFLIICLVLALYLNDWSLHNYKELLSNSGRAPSDFGHIYGRGISLFNMSLLGLIYTSFVLFKGQVLNGPILGGIFTIFGFGIFGKHLRNVLPVLVGTILAYEMNIYDSQSVGAMVTVLFATNLAPIAGEYGILAGIAAGFAHVSIVSLVGGLHGGLNLYNNGFSGGFVAAALVPMLEAIRNSDTLSELVSIFSAFFGARSEKEESHSSEI